MSDDLLDRFMGRGVPRIGGPPVANPRLTDPVGLQCLFEGPLALTAEPLAAALRAFHAEMAEGTVELHHVPPPAKPVPPTAIDPAVLGLLAWGPHVVKLVGFNTPMPASAVDACVRPAHFAPEFKEVATGHQSHLLLYYNGYDQDPLEQFVALAAVAGVLAQFGAVLTLNEIARTALPAPVLLPHAEDGDDILAAFRRLPLPLLYCGFVKIEVEGEPGVWMRTFGCHRFALADLAIRVAGHEEGTRVFELFSNLLAYQRGTGITFAPDDKMQVTNELFLQLRARDEKEWYLESEGQMLVAERIVNAS
jgi:hypothetical protein